MKTQHFYHAHMSVNHDKLSDFDSLDLSSGWLQLLEHHPSTTWAHYESIFGLKNVNRISVILLHESKEMLLFCILWSADIGLLLKFSPWEMGPLSTFVAVDCPDLISRMPPNLLAQVKDPKFWEKTKARCCWPKIQIRNKETWLPSELSNKGN